MRSVTYCCNESTIFKVGLTSTGSEGWFANKSGLAFAPVTAGQIGTKRIGSARLLEALVDIDASDFGITGESCGTGASISTIRIPAEAV